MHTHVHPCEYLYCPHVYPCAPPSVPYTAPMYPCAPPPYLVCKPRMMSIRSTARSTSPSMLLRLALALMASVATFPSCAMAMLPAHIMQGIREWVRP